MNYLVNNKSQKIAYKSIKGKSPGIVFIHGLNSDMNGTKALNLEKYAKKNNLAFTRFDCRGHGKSSGKFEEFTLSDWVEDVVTVIDNLTKGKQILIGSSMGGWLMILAAISRPKKIAGLIGLAAAADFEKELYNNLSKKNKLEIKKRGITKYISYGNNYYLTKNFFYEAKNNHVLEKLFVINKPIILIHGLKDKIVKKNMPERIMKKIISNNFQIVYVKNSDHRLSKVNDLKIINNSVDNMRSFFL